MQTLVEDYKKEAQQRWGGTSTYQEYEEKTKGTSKEQQNAAAVGLDAIMGEFAVSMKRGNAPECDGAQELVQELQAYITEHFYTCTNEILAGLGQMYVQDERFRENIDKHADGTAAFVAEAIRHYCR
ncbi:MAG: hypothetical protein E7449_02050 [Ruminococcaceae bacterium]|nr:hypothetical protein [Oscillospiraceae bacterium]